MTFQLTINTDGSAFCDEETGDHAPGAEIARILRRLADRIEFGGWLEEPVFDINGNRVGNYVVTNDDSQVEEARARVMAYLNEMDRVQSVKQQYADASHAMNQFDLNRSDLRLILGMPEGK